MSHNVTLLPGTVVSTVIDRRPIVFFVANHDDHIQRFHLKGEFYEQEELSIIARHCPSGACILDLGANVGNHVIYFDKFLNARLVRAVELNPAAIQVLKLNVALNDCSSVDLSRLGLGVAAKSERLKLMKFPRENWGGAQFVPTPDGEFSALPGDVLARDMRVDFIKLDVERMEMDVLAGLEETVSTWRPRMFIEVAEENVSNFHAWCQAMRYRIVETYQRYAGVWNYMAIPI